jgi:uncharacterized protein (UPF0218 family)
MEIRRLTPKLRKELKSPLGVLIPGTFEETAEALKELAAKEKPVRIISVGDVVSKNLMKGSLCPHVLVVDHKVMRKPTEPLEVTADRTLHVKNPPGVLTEESWRVMKEALRLNGVTQVVVEGEEDLLTLVAVLCAPKGSLVVYGQPDEGVVAVKVTEKTIGRSRNVVDAMEVR